MAEIAFRKFLFMAHSKAAFQPMDVPHTHFQVEVGTERAVLLTEPPFDAYRQQISAPYSYAVSQRLGTRMRDAGAELFTAFSARSAKGYNIGLFSPEAFKENRPRLPINANWTVFVTQDRVEFSQRRPSPALHTFHRADFGVDGSIPILG